MPIKENTANLSLSGDKSQMLSLFQKIGSGLFVLGLLFLYFAYENRDDKVYALLSFGLQMIGAFLFTYQGGQISFQKEKRNYFSLWKIIAYGFALLGFGVMFSAYLGWLPADKKGFYFLMMMIPLTLSIGAYMYGQYAHHTAGIKNNNVWASTLTGRGILGWMMGIALTYFYIQLYWDSNPFPQLVSLFDPLSMWIKGRAADRWFLYGTMYTFVILFLGIKFIFKYRHNRYQLIRTIVVIFSQLIFAYFIPQMMEAMSLNATSDGYFDANPVASWPFDYDAYQSYTLKAYSSEAYQPIGMAYFFWSIIMFLVITPVVTYFVGKRWYCSWFCGCGGLAETAGDPFRHLSNKSVKAWKIERWIIHSVMVFVLLMTLAPILSYLTGTEFGISFFTLSPTLFYVFASIVLLVFMGFLYVFSRKTQHKNKFLVLGLIVLLMVLIFFNIAYFSGTENTFVIESGSLKKTYAFFIGGAFSGVIGVGFYPILGNRIWCRFGCPMAGYMGIIQRFKSRFRITTNGGQCISCGNCSTYCEQGIDVRAYAQKGQNIVRASCVGCGICSAVCPRGVLKLENGPEEGRILDNPILLGKDGIKLAEFDAK